MNTIPDFSPSSLPNLGFRAAQPSGRALSNSALIMITAIFALLALGCVWGLALFPDPRLLPPSAMVNEKLTLLFLAVVGASVFVPALGRKWRQNHDAATFFLLAVSVVLFHIADRAGPRDGWAMTLPFSTESPVAISYAARLVVLGALGSIPLWWKQSGAPERAIVTGLLITGALGLGSLWFLGQYYPIGFDKTLDPTPTATLCAQVVSYIALALCCRAATATETLRTIVLRAVPLALLVVWARHQFAPIPVPAEEE